jgi:cytochrome c biogenesis protein CcmG/thiol:disulfide interchange protein DsbE
MTRQKGRVSATPSAARQRRLLQVVVVAVGVAIVVAVALISANSASEKAPATDVADPARFDLPALDGEGRVRLADFQGTPVVVNFFASWCGPCEVELPVFAEAARKLSGRVAFVAVNSQEFNRGAGLLLARRHRLEEAGITLARDVGPPPAKMLHDNLGRGMPLNAFYDADGNLLDTGRGALLEGKLPEVLKRLYGVDLEL